MLVGPSRKRFLGSVTGLPMEDRDRATATACALAYERGARLFRVHEVGRRAGGAGPGPGTGRLTSGRTARARRRRPPYAAAVGVTALVLLGYMLTLAPTVTFWDAGEFIAAAKTLGIPHPPGTPLFVMIAHVWALLLPLRRVRLPDQPAQRAAERGWCRLLFPRCARIAFEP